MTQTDFDTLVNEIKRAYAVSDIKRYADEHGYNRYSWTWGICTRINPHSVLILGFNPGAKDNEFHSPQVKLCNEGFLDTCNKVNGQDAGSLVRILSFLKKYPKYFPPSIIEQMGQANYCFFRSQNSGQITDHDVHLCEPIFERFLNMAEPSMILCFSSRARNYLIQFVEELVKAKNTVGYQPAKGVVSLGNKTAPVYFLPHPNYPIKTNVREQAWAFCFGAD